jgi:hypothetical protein
MHHKVPVLAQGQTDALDGNHPGGLEQFLLLYGDCEDV